MVLESGLAGGHKFEPHLCNLNICFPFVYLKVQKKILFCLSAHMRNGVKKNDIHIKRKYYKFELLRKLVVNLTWYQNLVWREVMILSHLYAI